MLINFLIVQTAPGGPVESLIASLNSSSHLSSESTNIGLTSKIALNNQNIAQSNIKYRGSQGIDPELIKKIEKIYGFDKDLWQRFVIMLKKYLFF